MCLIHYEITDINEEYADDGIHTFFDIIELIGYFIESAPALIIFFVRWRSLRQYEDIVQSNLQKTKNKTNGKKSQLSQMLIIIN
jgi:hypothetical protein